MRRRLPNILVTGTPGTGKSTLCGEVCESSGGSLEWINVGELAKERHLLEGYDNTLESHVLDEDKVVCELEDRMAEGGKVVDYHGCDFFPEEWFDIVFVLTTDNTLLYDRLAKRGYTGRKLEGNLQCEIFGMLLEEAQGAYDQRAVHTLRSDTPDDMAANVDRICRWVDQWQRDTLSSLGGAFDFGLTV